jgi:anti-sigma-K factor RskA
MSSQELIASGDLELYVAGLLPEEKAVKISKRIEEDEDVRKEVEAIEQIVLKLSKESTTQGDQDFTALLKHIVTHKEDKSTRDIKPEEASKPKVIQLIPYIGWAAAVLCLVFFGLELQETQSLQKSLDQEITEKNSLEKKLRTKEYSLAYKESLLEIITAEDTKTVQLAGQDISPESKVKAYWNANDAKVIIDAGTLPEAPEGMVYQLWSLKLNPLTPTSLGLLEDYTTENNLFVFDNANLSEGFGITLEPAGGSETPTLERLYVLVTTNV